MYRNWKGSMARVTEAACRMWGDVVEIAVSLVLR